MEWVHAEMAQGTGVSGSGKCSVASRAPRALFCMPTCAEPDHVSRLLVAGEQRRISTGTVCHNKGCEVPWCQTCSLSEQDEGDCAEHAGAVLRLIDSSSCD